MPCRLELSMSKCIRTDVISVLLRDLLHDGLSIGGLLVTLAVLIQV